LASLKYFFTFPDFADFIEIWLMFEMAFSNWFFN
jgi:hypothetical protein